MKTDLHIHTVQSDGGCTPEQIFSFARSAEISCVAITDHDRIPPFEQYRTLSRQYGVHVLPGTEVSAYDYRRGRRVHILAYGKPEGTPALAEICRCVSKRRQAAAEEMVRLVMQRYPITMEDVRYAARESNSIFKQHIMQTLMQAGYATELYGPLWQELFHHTHGSCLRNFVQLDVWEVLETLHGAGYLCVMAHPFTYNGIEILQELTAAGQLDGIEVWQSKTTAEQERFLQDFAQEHGLIPTGGSDFHGMFSSRVSPMGAGQTPDASLQRIEEQIGNWD